VTPDLELLLLAVADVVPDDDDRLCERSAYLCDWYDWRPSTQAGNVTVRAFPKGRQPVVSALVAELLHRRGPQLAASRGGEALAAMLRQLRLGGSVHAMCLLTRPRPDPEQARNPRR